MLNQQAVFETLERQGITFYTGVPDSYLNGFCNEALARYPDRTVIAANEGNAVGIAAGHWLAGGGIPLVFMQNSGLGNTVNPLCSLTEERVYAVPMILLIGWRGQPNTGDWPQHALQGEITPDLCTLLRIPSRILKDDPEDFAAAAAEAAAFCRENRKPFALIAPKGVMAAEKKANVPDNRYPLSREEAIEILLDEMPADTVFCATTGRATRELFWLRDRRGESRARDFLNVGSMGHCSSVALGIALQRPDTPVVVLDGDSASIMHLGSWTMVSKLSVPNLLHVVLNNGAHESVGGQPSAGWLVDFIRIAEGCGYRTAGAPAEDAGALRRQISLLRGCGQAALIDCRIHKGLRGKLPSLDFDHRQAADALREALYFSDKSGV